MSAPADLVGHRPRRGLARALLVVLALSAAFTLGVMGWAARGGPAFSGVGETVTTVLFGAWALAPSAVAAAVVVLVVPRVPGSVLAVALGAVALSATAVLGMVAFLTSESSTAALIFLWLPLYQGLAALVAAAVGVGLHLLLRRRAVRRPPAGGTAGPG